MSLLDAAKALRAAQRNYMADRGNEEKGRAVANAAAVLDTEVNYAEVAARSAVATQEAIIERTAQLAAHRACCGSEHDTANGKLHGYCVVCGVPWPCEYAGKPPASRCATQGHVWVGIGDEGRVVCDDCGIDKSVASAIQSTNSGETMSIAVADIARVAHEVNRAYCQALGDNSQPHWEAAPAWQRTSAINGVEFHIANPNAGPDHSHVEWLKEKEAAGWKYGPVKDAEKKEHPCFLPYDQLPADQKAKDYLFRGVVHAMLPL